MDPLKPKIQPLPAHPPRLTLEALEREASFSAVKSRGPGGQNVNKVSSAAVLSWNLRNTHCLGPFDLARITPKLQGRLNKDGELLIRSDEFRDLGQNKARCLEKLLDLLQNALFVPKVRKATRPTRGSKERKLNSKSKRGDTKRGREKVRF